MTYEFAPSKSRQNDFVPHKMFLTSFGKGLFWFETSIPMASIANGFCACDCKGGKAIHCLPLEF
jgi:hypothetical protein